MQLITRAAFSSSAVLVLTMLHHIYGAIIYSTPWRLHVLFFAGPMLIALIVAMAVNRRSPIGIAGALSKWILILVGGIGAVVSFGLYEGGYNHVVKNLVYFAGASAETLKALFPPPTYEMPNDLIFEVSGVGQFFLALWAAYDLVRLATKRGVRLDDKPSEDLGGAIRNV